jgi:hypothetical protein
MTDYSASLGFGVALSFTPASGTGSGVAVALDNILDLTPPNRNAPLVKFTPLDGTQAGNEQVAAGKKEVTECSLKCGYSAARYAALEALYRIAGTYVLTLNDGSILTAASSVMTKIAIDPINDSNIQTISMTFSVPAGWTTAAGTVTNLTQALSAGAATLDLTASPVSGTGKHVMAITFEALATNANPITIAKGASSGFAGFGATFSVVVAPGQQVTIYAAPSAAAIGSGNKALDLTGILAQSVLVSVLTY